MLIWAGHSHSGFIDYEGNYYAFGFNKDYRLMIAESK
jgi:alpha-tubulin suppressor-like RCC1 family protein